MVTYTVIIPHKDDFCRLQRLLNTIPKQKRIQVLVIDDGSKLLDLENFISGFSRMNVEIIKNDTKVHNAGKARNIGLKMAKGDWLIFADSDDVFTNCAFDVFDQHIESSSDLIYFGVTSIVDSTGELGTRHKSLASLINSYDESKTCSINELKYRHWVPWGKMIRRSLIERFAISFDEVYSSNDVMFSTKVAMFASVLTVDDSVVYRVSESENSLTTTKFNKQNINSRIAVLISFNNFMKRHKKYRYVASYSKYLNEAENLCVAYANSLKKKIKKEEGRLILLLSLVHNAVKRVLEGNTTKEKQRL